uniref:Beta-defensin n=1 Tax=Chrysemys picta bellii TaxID=8478 RepID=A0A8C3I8B7_CHRPI
MRILWFVLIFISLAAPGNAQGSEASCRRTGGLCLVSKCTQAEHHVEYCLTPVILCCKRLPVST